MSRRFLPWIDRTRMIAAVILVLGIGGCSGGGQTDSQNTGAGVAATGFAARLGIAGYDLEVSLDPDSLATIDVRGADGSSFGTVSVSLDGTGRLLAEYVGHNGRAASLTLLATRSADGSRVAYIETIEAAGRSLSTVSVADGELGELVSVSLEVLLLDGQLASALGDVSFRGDGAYAVLDMLDGETHLVSEEVYGQWLADLDLANLMASPEATLLSALMEDQALIESLTASLAALASEAPSRKAASDYCEDLRQQLREPQALSIYACHQCGQVDPAPASPFPLGFDTPASVRQYETACRKCAVKLLGVTGLPSAISCVSQWSEAGRQTTFVCEDRPHPWSVWALDSDTNTCELRCDTNLCDQSCSAEHSDEYGGQCLVDAGGLPSCSCELRDADVLCRGAFGDAYCGGGTRVPATDAEGNQFLAIRCVTAECGDTEVNGACGVRPAEMCDPSADQEGCGAPDMRCLDCSRPCEPCECDPFAQDCPTTQFCDGNCTCQPRNCQWSVAVGMLPGGSTYCDPTANDADGANGMCSDNQICRPDNCQCETVSAPVAEPDDRPDAGVDTGTDPVTDPVTDPDFAGSCTIRIQNDVGDTYVAGCTEYIGTLPAGGLDCQGEWSAVERCPTSYTALCSYSVPSLRVDWYVYFVPFGDQTCEEQISGVRDGCGMFPNSSFSGGC